MEPKRLCRASIDKKICGVCGGLAHYLGVDSQRIHNLIKSQRSCTLKKCIRRPVTAHTVHDVTASHIPLDHRVACVHIILQIGIHRDRRVTPPSRRLKKPG